MAVNSTANPPRGFRVCIIKAPGAQAPGSALIFENLKTMVKSPPPIKGKGVIAEVVVFRAARYPPPLSIIYPSFIHHLCSILLSDTMELCSR